MSVPANSSSTSTLTETHGGPIGHPPRWWPLIWNSLEPLVPHLKEIQSSIFEAVLSSPPAQGPSGNEAEAAQVYFFWYTLPVLEAAGLLFGDDRRSLVDIGAAQLALGLHLRHIDDLIDENLPATDRICLLERSHSCFSKALRKLADAGLIWGQEQDATYVQFFDYERESRAGMLHDFPGLWRRASPLCVLPDTSLRDSFSPSGLGDVFHTYISWALLRDDCDDALKDLNGGQVTPITAILREQMADDRHDLSRCADALERVRPVLASAERTMLTRLDKNRNKVWRSVIRTIAEISEGSDAS
jgi:hypothetical protein